MVTLASSGPHDGLLPSSICTRAGMAGVGWAPPAPKFAQIDAQGGKLGLYGGAGALAGGVTNLCRVDPAAVAAEHHPRHQEARDEKDHRDAEVVERILRDHDGVVAAWLKVVLCVS